LAGNLQHIYVDTKWRRRRRPSGRSTPLSIIHPQATSTNATTIATTTAIHRVAKVVLPFHERELDNFCSLVEDVFQFYYSIYLVSNI
jgi:hypothetical protein